MGRSNLSNISKIASLAHLSVCTRYIPVAPVKVYLFVVDMWTEKQKGGGVVIYLKINCNFSLEGNGLDLEGVSQLIQVKGGQWKLESRKSDFMLGG